MFVLCETIIYEVGNDVTPNRKKREKGYERRKEDGE